MAKKTVPNQKTVTVNKEKCDKTHLYATINLSAMDKAAQDLDAGAFKLWVYFSKNQDKYNFALSSSDVANTFGMKIKQYNNAVAQLIEKGYLVCGGGNTYTFNEIAVITKKDNEEIKENAVITKEDNDVITFEDNTLLPKDIRNITDTTQDNTIAALFSASAEKKPLDIPVDSEVSRLDFMNYKASGGEYEELGKDLYRIAATNRVVRVS